MSASNSFELFEHRFSGMTIIGIPGQGLLDSINQAINDTMDQFRNRQSQIGRARIFGEKSIGLDDPGMLAFKRMFESLQAGL